MPILSLDRYSQEYWSSYIVGRVIAEKGGDGSSGRDAVEYTDEEPSEGSIREGVPGREEG